MTTSQISFLSEILSGAQIPIGKLAYFRARLSNKIHELVLSEFMRLERENKINRAELARRVGRKPEQVTRWLGAPGNWTIETLSDLLLGMGCEPALSISSLAESTKSNVEDRWQLAPTLSSKSMHLVRLAEMPKDADMQSGLPRLGAGAILEPPRSLAGQQQRAA